LSSSVTDEVEIKRDLAPYVADECGEQAARVHLAGFVGHSGTLESGHCILLVRGSSSWTLFNGARVTELNADGALRIGLGQGGPRTQTHFSTSARTASTTASSHNCQRRCARRLPPKDAQATNSGSSAHYRM
jgi:hypothetical protein